MRNDKATRFLLRRNLVPVLSNDDLLGGVVFLWIQDKVIITMKLSVLNVTI